MKDIRELLCDIIRRSASSTITEGNISEELISNKEPINLSLSVSITYVESAIMGDNYTLNNSQAGSVGTGSYSAGNTLNQDNRSVEIQDSDLDRISDELSKIKAAMRASDIDTPDHFRAIACISEAENSAKNKNKEGIIKSLRDAGKVGLDFAREVGVDLTASLIKSYAGLP